MRGLVIDGEPRLRKALVGQLEKIGYQVKSCPTMSSAEDALNKNEKRWDFLVLDLDWFNGECMPFLQRMKVLYPGTSVILTAREDSMERGVEEFQESAADYLVKPIDPEAFQHSLARAVQVQLETAKPVSSYVPSKASIFQSMVGSGPAMRKVFERIETFGPLDSNVLIVGETGTGKELVARALHAMRSKAGGPFVVVPCGAVAETLAESELFGHEAGAFTGAIKRHVGSFEQAAGGTIFLDDIDDLPPAIQVKLLRVLQERSFGRVGGEREIPTNARVIAASKLDLTESVRSGRFREDLYYRLHVLTVTLPPLRNRRDDILPLAERFLREAARERKRSFKGISKDAAEKLTTHDWPGNIRELLHAIEFAVAVDTDGVLTAEDLPLELTTTPSSKSFRLEIDSKPFVDLREILRQFEKELFDWALQKAEGNQKKAARLLCIPRTTLQNRALVLKRWSNIP